MAIWLNRKCLGILLFWLCVGTALGQEQRYVVFYPDKDTSLFADYETVWDIPVTPVYLKHLRQQAEIIATSKWLNASLVVVKDSAVQSDLKNSDWVWRKVRFHANDDTTAGMSNGAMKEKREWGDSINRENLQLVNGGALDARGLTGKGVSIAIFDGGFGDLPDQSYYDRAMAEGRIREMINFTEDTTVFVRSDHGSRVMSVITGSDSAMLQGTAPDATFYLYVTEFAPTESIQEEFFWALAAERADSLGVQIINSSLGYSEFDDESENHRYADLTGNTTLISRAATIAARKGILVVTAAGNQGNKGWRYITAPADADSVLTVGAVNSEGKLAPFSGVGPTADGRIKPDVVALGWQTYLADEDQVFTGNGTSFSTPLIAGLCARLWESCPQCTAQQIRLSVIRSASQYFSPDSLKGFGIPDFYRALQLLASFSGPLKEKSVYPNPFDQSFVLRGFDVDAIDRIKLVDTQGRVVWDQQIGVYGEPVLVKVPANLPTGLYLLHVEYADQRVEVLRVERISTP